MPSLDLDRHYQESELNLQTAEVAVSPQGVWRLKSECLRHWQDPEPFEFVSMPAEQRVADKERALGEYIHRYLEYRAKYQQAAPISDATPEALQIIQRIEKSRIAAWLLAPHQEAHSEWPFVSINAKGEMVKNSIDRSFVAEGVRYIIDYKVARQQDSESLEGFLIRMKTTYAPQLLHYQFIIKQLDQRYPIRLGLYFPELDLLEYVDN